MRALQLRLEQANAGEDDETRDSETRRTTGRHHRHAEVGLDLLHSHVSRAFDCNDGASRGLRGNRSLFHDKDSRQVLLFLISSLAIAFKTVDRRLPHRYSYSPDTLSSVWYKHPGGDQRSVSTI